MKINQKFLDKIEDNYWEKTSKEYGNVNKRKLGINLKNSINEITVFKDNWEICKIEELEDMIKQLTMLRESIEEETGIEF